jgi:hypothetical protein
VSFQFSQVGTDSRARDFLSSLDEDPHIGHLIDCTSSKFHLVSTVDLANVTF